MHLSRRALIAIGGLTLVIVLGILVFFLGRRAPGPGAADGRAADERESPLPEAPQNAFFVPENVPATPAYEPPAKPTGTGELRVIGSPTGPSSDELIRRILEAMPKPLPPEASPKEYAKVPRVATSELAVSATGATSTPQYLFDYLERIRDKKLEFDLARLAPIVEESRSSTDDLPNPFSYVERAIAGEDSPRLREHSAILRDLAAAKVGLQKSVPVAREAAEDVVQTVGLETLTLELFDNLAAYWGGKLARNELADYYARYRNTMGYYEGQIISSVSDRRGEWMGESRGPLAEFVDLLTLRRVANAQSTVGGAVLTRVICWCPFFLGEVLNVGSPVPAIQIFRSWFLPWFKWYNTTPGNWVLGWYINAGFPCYQPFFTPTPPYIYCLAMPPATRGTVVMMGTSAVPSPSAAP